MEGVSQMADIKEYGVSLCDNSERQWVRIIIMSITILGCNTMNMSFL